jgi:TRAP-type uncharacterized transport system substrate-binding protein
LEKLNQGLADIALLQNDIVGNEGVRAVAKLYSEVLHVIAREKNLKTSFSRAIKVFKIN